MIQTQHMLLIPTLHPRSCATFRAGQDGLQERLHIAGHAQSLHHEDTLTDLSEMLKSNLGLGINSPCY